MVSEPSFLETKEDHDKDVVVVARENTNQERGRSHLRDVIAGLEIQVGRVEDVISED